MNLREYLKGKEIKYETDTPYIGVMRIGYYRDGDALVDVYTDGSRLYLEEFGENLTVVPVALESRVLENLIRLEEVSDG